jgi:hypothetical protein
VVIITYSPGIPSAAGPITGPVSVCAGSTQTYSISPVSGASSYAWTVPGGAVINSGQGTTSISVTFGSTSGPITVTPSNSCGSSAPASLSVTVNAAPVVNLGTDITQCGGTTVLNAQNNGSTYLWSTNATTQTITVSTSGTYSVVVTGPGGCTGTDAINVTINTPPTVNLGSDITQCSGTAVLDAQNGGSTYLWSNAATTQTISVSASGTYSVVVTDANGCTGTDAINVTFNTPPIVTLGSDITQCGGTAVLDAQNAGSTYLWSTNSTTQTITVSASGTYSVVVTDPAGCTGTDAINVTINTPPVVALGNDISQCGGTVVLDAQNAGNTYLWSNSATTQTITVSASGTYSVVVTDANGCTGSDVINVSINSSPTVNLGNNINQCGGTVLLDAQNAGGTYLWSTSATTQTITVSTSGSYSVVVTDVNGCTGTGQVNININTPPVVTFTLNPVNVCVNWLPFTLSGGSPNGGTYSGTGVSGGVFDPAAAGIGTFTITYVFSDAFGCSDSASQSITVNACTGITENTLGQISIYPNPSNGLLTISLPEHAGRVELAITDPQGKTVYSTALNGNNSSADHQVDLSQLANGTYFVKISSEGHSRIEKLVISK